MRLKLILAMASVLSIIGCSDFSPAETAEEMKVKRYFDLEGFIDSEVKRLSGKSDFAKTAFINGESESVDTMEVDLQKELAIFEDSDINRPAWSDKYKIDSVFSEDRELVKLAYGASDKKLRTRQISIEMEGGEVSRILIDNQTSTAIADAQQTLVYEPAIGYSIESKQQVETMNDAILRIEVKY